MQDLFNRNLDGHLTTEVKDVDIVGGSGTNQLNSVAPHQVNNVTINSESFVEITMWVGGNTLFSSTAFPATSAYTTLSDDNVHSDKTYLTDWKFEVDSPGGTHFHPYWLTNQGNRLYDTNDEVLDIRINGSISLGTLQMWMFQENMTPGDKVRFRLDSMKRASFARFRIKSGGLEKLHRPAAPWEYMGVGEYQLDTATFPY